MRGSTKIEILKNLRFNPGLSRSELAIELGMNKGNITRAIKDMIQKNWLNEEKEDTTDRGQPKTNLYINKDAFYSIGISITNKIYITIVDGRGNKICQCTLANTFHATPSNCTQEIIKNIIKQSNSLKGHCLGIGIVTSGTYSKTHKHFFDNFYLGQSENADELINELKHLKLGNVYPELIANVYPLAEYQSDESLRQNKTIVCMTDRLDIGILWDGKMASGISKRKLSAKHIKVNNNVEMCNCGKSGCLITVSSLWSMMDKLKGFIPGSRGIPPYETIEKERKILFEMLQEKDPKIYPIVKRATEAICQASENIAVLLNPDAFYFDYWLGLIPEIGINLIQKHFKEYESLSGGKIPRIELISHGPYQASVGAAAMVIENSFGNSTTVKRIGDLIDAS